MPTLLLLKYSTELLAAILDGALPADAQMERYFRSHPKLGARDRGEIAETVYACLRRRRSLGALATGNPDVEATAEQVVAAALVRQQGMSARTLEAANYSGDARVLVERVRTTDAGSLPEAVRLDLPDWLHQRLRDQYGADETGQLAAALHEPATLDLRVNTLKATREEAAACLAESGYPSDATPFSPVGLRRRERAPLFRTRCFADGLIEVQDEGSQLLSLLMEPKRNEMVADFCAGAGGKTLHLGALMSNTGSLYAFDISARRLERLKPRLRRAGLHNARAIAIQHERDPRVQRLAGKFDRVLVDAPCSGTGTLRRSPDIKWRPIDVARLTESQRSILAAAAALVKPGGRLVYATCSLLRSENEDIVAEFLGGNPAFEPLPVNEILMRRHVSLVMNSDALHLLPHRHHTDGFFATVLTRR